LLPTPPANRQSPLFLFQDLLIFFWPFLDNKDSADAPANVPDYNGLRLFQQQNFSLFLYICIAVLMLAFIGILIF